VIKYWLWDKNYIFIFKKWNGINFFNTTKYNLKKNIADDPSDEWYDSPFDYTDYTINKTDIKKALVVKSN